MYNEKMSENSLWNVEVPAELYVLLAEQVPLVVYWSDKPLDTRDAHAHDMPLGGKLDSFLKPSLDSRANLSVARLAH